MKRVNDIANTLAAKCPTMEWDKARDWLDFATGNDLDCIELDILTDCVVTKKMKAMLTKAAERKHDTDEAA